MTCYDVLEVTPSASDKMIQMAYRHQKMKYNPETYSGGADAARRRLEAIEKAYAVLSDPETRRKYDQYLLKASKAADTKPAEEESKPKTKSQANHSKNHHRGRTKKGRNRSVPVLACIFAVILIVLTGLGIRHGILQKKSPEPIVTAFCEAMHDFDMETMQSFLLHSNTQNLPGGDDPSPIEKSLLEYIAENAEEIEYEIEDCDYDGDEGTVTVHFTYVDSTPVITAAISEYMPQALMLTLGGADESLLETTFANILTQKAEEIRTVSAEATVDFSCTRTDDGWKIAELTDEALNVLTSNIYSVGEQLGNESPSGEEPDDENYIWIDISAGTEAELAMIKIGVLDSVETSAILVDDESINAPDGTKFVVFTIAVENISKELFDFDMSGYLFYDSQGRNFEPFDDITWYSNEHLHYRELPPNIPATGIVVYNVPLDASDYYFTIRKADTSEIYRFYGKDTPEIVRQWRIGEPLPEEHTEKKLHALDFVNKTTGDVVKSLGNQIVYTGAESGCYTFYHSSESTIHFGYVPHDWAKPEIAGDEPIAIIWLRGDAKISSNLTANLTKSELDKTAWDTPGVRNVKIDSSYSELYGESIYKYIIETETATIEYLWYMDSGKGLDYPASEVYVLPDQPEAVQTPPAGEEVEIEGYVIESSGGLRIRSGPSTSYEEVGGLAPLEAVTILEIRNDGTRDWGRIDRGWVCMDYIAQGTPPEKTVPQDVISMFCGTWGDRIGMRCMMTVTYQNGEFLFDIKWGSGASSTETWLLTGKYDPATNSILYKDGKHTTLETNASGQQTTHVHYTNGTGKFHISNGYMYWQDDNENAGAECEFERAGY